MLSKAAEWLRVVVETAVDGIVLIDAKGTILVFNPAAVKIFGYAPEEVVGRNVKILMPGAYHEQHDDYLNNYHRTNVRKIIGIGREVLGRRKDCSIFPIRLSVGEACQDGEPLYVGTIHDITESKCAEERRLLLIDQLIASNEERRLLIEQLIASNEERGHFAYVASHDLQQHLRMVLAFNTLVLEEYGSKLDDKARQYLTLSLNASGQMRDLLGDLLEYGRLSADLDCAKSFDTAVEMNQVLEILDDSVRSSDAEIEIGPMPILYGNPVRFRRLMQNLLTNAIKYVAPAAVPSIGVSASEERNFWRFRVKDNGIGIDPAYHRKIFDPFKRLHTNSEYVGSGLGLAICRKIVVDFGGAIWVESDIGRGSSFNFTIAKRGGDL
jgi:two-component system, LuxR family, sensor kinase FixL